MSLQHHQYGILFHPTLCSSPLLIPLNGILKPIVSNNHLVATHRLRLIYELVCFTNFVLLLCLCHAVSLCQTSAVVSLIMMFWIIFEGKNGCIKLHICLYVASFYLVSCFCVCNYVNSHFSGKFAGLALSLSLHVYAPTQELTASQCLFLWISNSFPETAKNLLHKYFQAAFSHALSDTPPQCLRFNSFAYLHPV